MPAGCDFTCSNKKCEKHNHGFTMTAYWPMGQIELIVNSIAVKKNKDLRERIIKLKNEDGVKLFVIQLPNEELIPVKAFRASFWSPMANCIWNYEIPITEHTDIDALVEEAKKNNILPTVCEKTNGRLMDFNEVVTEGIECPFCNKKMSQSRWFTKEKGKQ